MNNLNSVEEFFKTRRSTPPISLIAPFPSKDQLIEIAEMGMRVPDHKKLEPWRLIIMEKSGIAKLSKIVDELSEKHVALEKREKLQKLYQNSGALIALVYVPQLNDAVPEWEQMLSTGAVGVSLVNAAISKGFGATWQTGFLSEAPEIAYLLDINSDEKLVGLIHIGTSKGAPPERPRPSLEEKITFF